MVEKSSAWTDEERAEMARRRIKETVEAYEWPTEYERLRNHDCPIDEHCHGCVDEARWDGAAVAFGLMGMAFALRANPMVCDWRCISCNTYNSAGAECCDDCGADYG